ncbi:PLP-dependent aminotransferase family protein [uncultured Veillonella sp.]|uniref:MocR-like pyridoxine biosynthesis transcription factor PdxR n=1 Tax=uncultured Veillonella sp. TaxID=159268 RepID=UPI0025F3AC7B|nr:PLP-dependent aminotransferase family protein [uncultured Veillonella sp.]
MLVLDRQSGVPLYEQIYSYIKSNIENGTLAAGIRLPSVRALAGEIGVSKITVEQAYVQLAAEGYLKSHDRAPYEVLELPLNLETDSHRDGMSHFDTMLNLVQGLNTLSAPYNFATGAMDPEGFDYSRWKRYIGYVLRDPERLMAYGNPQGETELRMQLQGYLSAARGVTAEVEQIIVSSGTQPMAIAIASLLKRAGFTTIGIEKEALGGIKIIFEDYGFTVVEIEQRSETLFDILEQASVEIVYCTPSHGDRSGSVMTVARRKELLQWAQQGKRYIIEDDYDSELRYYGRPISSLQGMSGVDRVIYVGTPSKVLPPSIRLSYMVLPPPLWLEFMQHRNTYKQSASVMEQLVWARFIEAGEWSKQIRRLRKHYADKSKLMVKFLHRAFGDTITVKAPEGGVYISLVVHTKESAQNLVTLAHHGGCDVRCGEVIDNGVQCVLSFSAIPTNKLASAIEQLAKAWKGI